MNGEYLLPPRTGSTSFLLERGVLHHTRLLPPIASPTLRIERGVLHHTTTLPTIAPPGESYTRARLVPQLTLHALPCQRSDFLLPAGQVCFVVVRGVQIGGGIEIGVEHHAQHADQNPLHPQNRPPPLVRRLLLVKSVGARRVQDGDADLEGVSSWERYEFCGYYHGDASFL